MEVNSSRLKMNAVNVISRFRFQNTMKYAIYNAISLSCILFILCPTLKLVLQW